MKFSTSMFSIIFGVFSMLIICSRTVIAQNPGATSKQGINHDKQTQVPGDEKWDDRFCDIGTNYAAWCVATIGNDVYIGGEFTTAGGAPINHIAKWNGRSYLPLGEGLTVSYPYMTIDVTPMRMVVHGTDLYVCGNFRVAGADTVNGIAKWNGSSWSSLGSGANAAVRVIVLDGNYLYAGGFFTTISGISANRIARYNLTTGIWEALGPGVGNEIHGEVRDIVVNGGAVYAGGSFMNAGETTVNNIAVWNGVEWSQMNGGVVSTYQSSVNAMVAVGADLFVGGEFALAGGIFVNNFARWDGANWNPVGSGMDYPVNDLDYDGADLYLMGAFSTVNGTPVTHIAIMNPSTYAVSSFGAGLYSVSPGGGTVMSITIKETDTYAVGYFTGSDSVQAYNIARWNGVDNKWYALGMGLNSNVYALSVRPSSPADVFVGGQFSRPGGKFINRVAKFSGDDWTPMGSGILYFCYTMAATASDCYVAGSINNAGGLSVNNIAKWTIDPEAWSALGNGLTGGFNVNAVAVRGTEVFAGGDFTTAGGNPANRIARWDGTNWSPLGSGVNGEVRAIAITDSFVYVGGYFTSAGGTAANYVARWDGTNWTTLGSGPTNGTDYRVYALAVSGNDVYAGGTFENAGGVSALNIAKWNSISNTWSSLGGGVSYYGSGIVNSIAALGKNIYVGGALNMAGTVSVNNIALWNDSSGSWSALGSGVDNEVKVLAVSSAGKLYVGGIFLNAGEKPSRYFAIWDGSSATAPNPPSPVSPANDTSCVSLSPTLQWSLSEGASSYRVQVSTDSLFAVSFLDSSNITSSSILVVGLSGSTKYYWRVNASNTAGASIWSTVYHFTTGTGILIAPLQVSPEHGATGIPASTTLYWQNACGAQSYYLQIAYDSTFTSFLFNNGGITRTSYDLFELLSATWHFWRLRSVNGVDTSNWSSTWKFRTWGGEPYPPTLAGPANDTMCIALHPLLQWNAAPGATEYRIQLSTDSLFGAVVFDSSHHASTSITVAGLLPLTRYYWHVNASNTYGTSGWSGVRRFTTRTAILPAPPQTSPANGAFNIPVATTLSWTRPCGAQTFYLQIAYDSGFTGMVFSNGGIMQTSYNLSELPTATWHYWRLRSVSGIDTSVWSPTWKFQTVGGTVEVTANMNNRWNLISIPVTRTDYRRSILFPSSTSQAFSYTGSGYAATETLANKHGFWLKFGSAGSVTISGLERMSDTFYVSRGWNLVGSISQTISVQSITSLNPGLITSSFYGYNNGYIATDSIKPGCGYWVQVNKIGQMILSTTTTNSTHTIAIVSSSELPPPPPAENSPDDLPLPTSYSLNQNYPNPFNPTTNFEYRIPSSGFVSIKIFNMLGVEVATLVNEVKQPGDYHITWNANEVPSGVYYYKITVNPSIDGGSPGSAQAVQSFSDIKKLILVK